MSGLWKKGAEAIDLCTSCGNLRETRFRPPGWRGCQPSGIPLSNDNLYVQSQRFKRAAWTLPRGGFCGIFHVQTSTTNVIDWFIEIFTSSLFTISRVPGWIPSGSSWFLAQFSPQQSVSIATLYLTFPFRSVIGVERRNKE